MALPQKSSRRFPVSAVAVIAVLALLAAAIWYLTRPKPIAVTLAKVERGVVEATVSNTRAGTVKACRRAKLAAPAGGQIERLLVKKGQRVKHDQVLLELWNDDLRAQERLAQEQLNTAQTQAQQACLQADLAEKEAERARQLMESGFISPEGLDQKLSAAKVSRAGCEAAQQSDRPKQITHLQWRGPAWNAWCCVPRSTASWRISAANWVNTPLLRRRAFRHCPRST